MVNRLTIVAIPMSSWKLKLMNIQQACKEYVWKEDTVGTQPSQGTLSLDSLIDAGPDLVRLPANAKSSFALEEFQWHAVQQKYRNSFLASIGINRDLSDTISRDPNKPTTNYEPPAEIHHCISQSPELLAADLYRCLDCGQASYTVEDKDPSVLWRLNSNHIVEFWRNLLKQSPDRWAITNHTEDEVIQYYRSILDNILPRNLLQKRNTFSATNVPYTYFTVKYKCFQNAAQEICTRLVKPSPTCGPVGHSPGLPAHTCVKAGHSCLRNIMSFCKIPGRKTFKRIGRAFMFGLASVAPGYSIRDLSRGKDLTIAELKKQLPRQSSDPCCLRCGCHLNGPTLHTADAG